MTSKTVLPQGYKKISAHYVYDDDGLLNNMYYTTNDVLDGLKISFDDDGVILSLVMYKNGIIDANYKHNGDLELVHHKGSKLVKCHFVNGNLHGKYSLYGFNNDIFKTWMFDNGKKHGQHVAYMTPDEIVHVYTYDNDKLISRTLCDTSNCNGCAVHKEQEEEEDEE